MRKNLYEIFDEAKPEELDRLSGVLEASALPPKTLSSIKDKVYAKTGLTTRRKNQKRLWLRIGAIASCLALMIGAVIAIQRPLPKVPVPIWDDAHYTAEDIAALFDMAENDAAATNAYKKIYVPDARYLYIGTIPEDEYLGVYQYRYNEKALNQREFKAFIDGILPKLADAVGVDLPSYKIEKCSCSEDMSVSESIGIYTMQIEQNKSYHRFHLSAPWHGDDRTITLAGVPIQIDQRLSDEDILRSIEPMKAVLSDIFGVSFSSAKIIRRFNADSEYGAAGITIDFYNENAGEAGFAQDIPVFDHISIDFDNVMNYADDIVSDSILTVAVINYYRWRYDTSDIYAHIADAKKISLEDAEALLYNGYVFGGHVCPLCMAAQDKVSFDNYDFVDMEYVYGRDPKNNKPTMGLPFYAFYKKIGTSENGNTIYAKTYVPAIEVKGLDEYFRSQTSSHKNNSSMIGA